MTLSLILIGTLYLGIIFAAAWYFEKRFSQERFKRWMPYIYSLALAVYCTAWTFYGSIGRAAQSGLDFLLIYLGPALMMFLWHPMAKRLFRIKRTQGISSLADFLSARYGKDQNLGFLVALLSLVGILPYISLQIKAISESFSILSGQGEIGEYQVYNDPALYVSLIMFVFTILFGTRYVQSNRPKAGLIGTIAFESLFKLIAFVVVGAIGLSQFAGTEVFSEGLKDFALKKPEMAGGDWFSILLISAFAFFLLPRQFQMGVVENNSEKNLAKATWLFPLYLLIINLFVLPFAVMGTQVFPTADSDFYLLSLSMKYSGPATASLAFLGGLSAASSMIIVSTLALGNMLSTYVLVPRLALKKDRPLSRRILGLRRWAILLILALAYVYYHFFAAQNSLVSIGLVSFVAMSQFAPAFLGGLYWREAKRKAAFWSILSGFVIWFYFLVLPQVAAFAGWDLMQWGLLNPEALAATFGLSLLSAATLLSLSLNTIVFVLISLESSASLEEANQATLFVSAPSVSANGLSEGLYRGSAPFPDIRSLLQNFLGRDRAEEVLERYARLNNIDWSTSPTADNRVISFAERLLSEAIGPASAKIMISSVVQREELSRDEVLGILEESQKVLRLNRELSKREEQLRLASEELQHSNRRLQEMTELKDEFLYTVTHELRTPLAAIRMQAELLQDEPEMPAEDRERFVNNIVSDCERLSRLISNVLDLEKFESGSQKLSLSKLSLDGLIRQSVEQLENLALSNGVHLSCEISAALKPTFADADRIQQVLTNLIGNAIKFANPKQGKVWVTAYQLDDDLKVNIHDNGKGIPEADRQLIFDKFYQVRDQTRRKPSGSGLGLAISKNIIAMHKGRIWVDDDFKAGAKISFTLPIYKGEKNQKKTEA